MNSSPTASGQQAANLLGVAPGASAAEARSTFLQRLEQVDFVPPAEWCAGLSGLDTQAIRGGFRCVPRALEATNRDTVRADLESFRRDYWHLDPLERILRWQAVHERCCREELRLCRQVWALEGGLTIDEWQFDEPKGMQAAIAGLIRETFTLNVVERSTRKNAWIAGLKTPSAWRLTARLFRKDHPDLAQLDAELIAALEQLDSDTVKPVPRFEPNLPSKTSQWLLALLIAVFLFGLAVIEWSRPPKTPHIKMLEPYRHPTYEDLTPAQKAVVDSINAKRVVPGVFVHRDYGARVIDDVLRSRVESTSAGGRP